MPGSELLPIQVARGGEEPLHSLVEPRSRIRSFRLGQTTVQASLVGVVRHRQASREARSQSQVPTKGRVFWSRADIPIPHPPVVDVDASLLVVDEPSGSPRHLAELPVAAREGRAENTPIGLAGTHRSIQPRQMLCAPGGSPS